MAKKRRLFLAVLSVVITVALTFVVVLTIRDVNRHVRQNCFDDLQSGAKSLAEDMHRTMDTDRTLLQVLGMLIAHQQDTEPAQVLELIQGFKGLSPYVRKIEWLTPDGLLLSEDGSLTDVSGQMSFAEEAAKGAYISDKSAGLLDSSVEVVRNAVPVVQNGQTIGILYGLIPLMDVMGSYQTQLYGGEAYVFVVDGLTGDFLLDTWHQRIGNIWKMDNRTMLDGYTFAKAQADMALGESGNLGFVSQTTGEVLYLHYEPAGINQWSVMIAVTENTAFRSTRSISSILYQMAGVCGALLLAFMGCVLLRFQADAKVIHQMSIEDQTTHLQNRAAFEQYLQQNQNRVFSRLCCQYWDANGLHELNNRQGHAAGDRMLCAIGEILKESFSYQEVYRVGGDEFVVLCERFDPEECRARMHKAHARIEKLGYGVASGMACCENKAELEKLIREADALMLDNKRAFYRNHDRRSSR